MLPDTITALIVDKAKFLVVVLQSEHAAATVAVVYLVIGNDEMTKVSVILQGSVTVTVESEITLVLVVYVSRTFVLVLQPEQGVAAVCVLGGSFLQGRNNNSNSRFARICQGCCGT